MQGPIKGDEGQLELKEGVLAFSVNHTELFSQHLASVTTKKIMRYGQGAGFYLLFVIDGKSYPIDLSLPRGPYDYKTMKQWQQAIKAGGGKISYGLSNPLKIFLVIVILAALAVLVKTLFRL